MAEHPQDEPREDDEQTTAQGDESAQEFKEEIESDPSANPPEELDRLRGG
jgi:hypothetical protein